MNTQHTKDPALDPAAHASTAQEDPVQTPTATDTAKEQKKKTSPRLPTTQQIELHSEDPDYVSKAIQQIGPTLDEICQKNHWHIDALKDRFDSEYFPNASSFSRVLNSTVKRRPSAGQLFELRRVAGISLDKLADGCNPFEFEQMSVERLIELNEMISAELSRRIRQQRLPDAR